MKLTTDHTGCYTGIPPYPVYFDFTLSSGRLTLNRHGGPKHKVVGRQGVRLLNSKGSRSVSLNFPAPNIFAKKLENDFLPHAKRRKQKYCVILNRVSPNRPSPRKILDPPPRTEKSSFFLEKNLAGKLTMRSGCGSSLTRLENPMVVARKLRQAVYNRIKCGPVLETFACWNKVELFLFSSGSFYLFQTFLSNS